jgi:hypothetical protein
MLGFRGHFSTKSRRYSTTLGALRADRAQHQRDYSATASLWPAPESETTLVLTHWHFAGQGSPSAPLTAGATRPADPPPPSPPKEASHAPAFADRS